MKTIKDIFCFLYLHNWKYKIEYHTCEGISSHIKNININIRECRWCKKRQSYTLPTINGMYSERHWSDAKFIPGEHLKFKRAYQ